MALSKPIYNLLGVYFEQLFNHPIRTKSLTSCCIATSANFVSQKIAGNKEINQNSLFSYGLFGLLFGGTLPHYFYKYVDRMLADDLKGKNIYLFLMERLMYTPVYQVLSLYFLTRFEGKSHDVALKNLMALYWPILQANWKFLSGIIFLNVTFVPPMLRVLIANFIGFFWVIFVAQKRRKVAAKLAKEKSSSKSSNDSSDKELH